jgi:hypothetical protein
MQQLFFVGSSQFLFPPTTRGAASTSSCHQRSASPATSPIRTSNDLSSTYFLGLDAIQRLMEHDPALLGVKEL